MLSFSSSISRISPITYEKIFYSVSANIGRLFLMYVREGALP